MGDHAIVRVAYLLERVGGDAELAVVGYAEGAGV